MAAPVDSARQATNVTTAATTHNVNVGSPVVGTLLIVFARFAAAPGAVTFTGYTVLAGPDATDATDDTTTWFYRWSDGTEGPTDPCNPTNSVKAGYISWEVTGADNPGLGANSVPGVSAVAIGTTVANTCSPNSVAPKQPPQDTLYVVGGGGDQEVGAFTAVPTNYVNLQAANSGTGGAAASNVIMGGASRQISASSSDDAGVFTHAAMVAGWTAFAIAIRAPQAGFVDNEALMVLQAVNRSNVY